MRRAFFALLLVWNAHRAEGADLATVKSLQNRLAEEVQKMIDAGHLAPAYSYLYLFFHVQDFRRGFEMDEYFSNPAELVYTLAIAIPHLPPALQPAAKEYLRAEFNRFPPHTYTHMGCSGVRRETSGIATEYRADFSAAYQLRCTPATSSADQFGQYFVGWDFSPVNFYACWKYAQVMGLSPQEVKTDIFDKMRSKIQAVPPDVVTKYGYTVDIRTMPRIFNEHIAGYYGYLGMQDLIGETRDPVVERYLVEALARRSTLLSTAPQTYEGIEVSGLGGIVPELAVYLRQNSLARLEQIMDYQDWATPYWNIERADEPLRFRNEGYTEHCITTIYETGAMFQARANISRWPAEKLKRYLDAPRYNVGDLTYLQNLVAVINAGGDTPSDLTPPRPPSQLRMQ